MTTADLDDGKRERRRQQCRNASRRRREREKLERAIFKLELKPTLVALGLYALARDRGLDLSKHSDCERALADLIESHLSHVIDDCASQELHALLTALNDKPKT